MNDFVATSKFIVFQEHTEEFLSKVEEGHAANLLLWSPAPEHAKQYGSADAAIEEAQRIADNQEYELIVCELEESETQVGLREVVRVEPRESDPHQNAELN